MKLFMRFAGAAAAVVTVGLSVAPAAAAAPGIGAGCRPAASGGVITCPPGTDPVTLPGGHCYRIGPVGGPYLITCKLGSAPSAAVR